MLVRFACALWSNRRVTLHWVRRTREALLSIVDAGIEG